MVLQRGESVLHICGLFQGASVAGNRSATGVRLPRTTARKPLLQAPKTKNTGDQIQNFLKLMGAF